MSHSKKWLNLLRLVSTLTRRLSGRQVNFLQDSIEVSLMSLELYIAFLVTLYIFMQTNIILKMYNYVSSELGSC